MKIDRRGLLLGVGGLAGIAFAAEWLVFQKGETVPDQAQPWRQMSVEFGEKGHISVSDNTSLPSGLIGLNATSREKLLQQWADTIDVNAMAETLVRMELLKDDKLKFESRAALLKSWGERDLGGEITWFGGRGGADGLHQQARDLLGQSITERDPAQMLDWMQKSMPESERRELDISVCQQWMKFDPAATADLVRQMIAASSGHPDQVDPEWIDVAGEVAAQWANTDLNGTVHWAESLPQGAAKSAALVQLSYQWTVTSPQAAAGYAAQQNDPALLQAVASKWSENDPQSAVTWALGLPAGQGRDNALSAIASRWAQKDPASAAAYASSLSSNPAQDRLVLGIVSSLAERAPAQTAQWVAQFSESPLRAQAIATLMNSWAGENATEANQWLQNLPTTPSRDSAIGAFSSAIASTSPEAAFQWAGKISNEGRRIQSMEEIAMEWMKRDPSAAQKSVASSSLPEAIKNQFATRAGDTR